MTDTNKMREEFEREWGQVDSAQGVYFIPELNTYSSELYAQHEYAEMKSSAWFYFQKGWQASRQAVVPVWQAMDTCPQHTEVLFYRSDAGVFSGMITDADHFLNDKERDEWEGTEQEMFDLDAFGFGDWGVCRCDGSERPTYWMPLPVEPEVQS